MKVAIIHYWLVSNRGGEKVLETLCELFPNADIFTHVYIEEKFKSSVISKHNIKTTFISKLPFANRLYQTYLPLMPLALEEVDLSGYDLVISSESGPAKGVIVPAGVRHICYCHSPMRYAWDMYHDYKKQAGKIKRLFMSPIMHYLRRWDQLTSVQVTDFIANSTFVAQRIKSYYNRDAIIIHPPVNVENFNISYLSKDFYLMLGQLVNYKKTDLAVKAFNQSGKRLVIIGDGEQLELLKTIARPNIEVLGSQPFEVVKEYLMNCKALIFPGIEDFGIVPVEAMACGKPIIAYARGGILDSVINNVTGVFFYEQSEKALNDAILKFELSFTNNPCIIRKHAESFSKAIFKKAFLQLINE